MADNNKPDIQAMAASVVESPIKVRSKQKQFYTPD